MIITVVIGALGTVKKHFEKWIEKLDLDLTTEALQNPCLLGAARWIGKMLDMKWKKKWKNEKKKKRNNEKKIKLN